jgi:aspartate-semialdehyde dehydrogenase
LQIKSRIGDRVSKQVLDQCRDHTQERVERQLYSQIDNNMLPWLQRLRDLYWAVDNKLEQDIEEILQNPKEPE